MVIATQTPALLSCHDVRRSGPCQYQQEVVVGLNMILSFLFSLNNKNKLEISTKSSTNTRVKVEGLMR